MEKSSKFIFKLIVTSTGISDPLPPQCDEDQILIQLQRICGNTIRHESFEIYEGSGIEQHSRFIYSQYPCVPENKYLCLNPTVHAIVLKDLWSSGWDDRSYVNMMYGNYSTIFRLPSGDSITYYFDAKHLPLTKTVMNCDDWHDMNDDIEIIHVNEKACDYFLSTNLNTQRFSKLKVLYIKDENFKYIRTFSIIGNNYLMYIKIGQGVFYEGFTSRPAKSFRVLNCTLLKSIDIGLLSFYDFAGDFELKNLPSLQIIKTDSSCFKYNSFVIKGISIFLLIRNK